MRHTASLSLIAILAVVLFVIAVPADAQFQQGFSNLIGGANQGGNNLPLNIYNILFGVLVFLTSFLSMVALGALLWGGFTYITALGDEDKAARAKRIILFAIIGLIIIGLSVLIVNAVINVFQLGGGGGGGGGPAPAPGPGGGGGGP